MARKKQTGPTEKEMTILSILWKRGASTVREINTIMNHDEDTGYTTTLKLMQIMYEKELLKRDTSSKTHVYFPANSEEQIQSQVIGNIVSRVFAGSTEKLMMRVLSSQEVSEDELASLKKLIEAKEQEMKS
ncbi:BlaI/MecI/CopY family transcriptional regulator [candidate division KSB1 bacterium]|nr:BlaI/MecI/CopY family transcriptional regulator [candidate division KSB1 bacterium]